MKKYLFLYFTSLYWAFACKPNDTFNESHVDEATMIAIMTEVYYMDSHFAELNSHVKDSIVYLKFTELLKKHLVSKDKFEKTQKYYNDNDLAHQRLEEGIKKAVNEALKN